MGNLGSPTTRPQSYAAERIQVSLSEIRKELQSCINSFERVFGAGKEPLRAETKKQPEPELPFVQINNSLDRILEDLRYLAGRLDSEL